ncbi:hypothetical protein GDO86_007722 [Hymenochirus boettgeri]|uniref:Coiled-coil domain-containing protein 18 n=1 Tax=Hymenochirus boettgeri TaxID=247094 RepID=A0A8T2IUX0_9PIPI|nr:hypothetical protein GDO86_007722 [Hymenochirus boettgeri]
MENSPGGKTGGRVLYGLFRDITGEPFGAGIDNSSEHSLSRAPLGLTLEDLEEPNQPVLKENQQRSNTVSQDGGKCLRKINNKPITSQTELFKRNAEQDNRKLKENLNFLQEQNASLVYKNRLLMDKIDCVQSELAKSRSRIRFVECAVGARKTRMPDLEERIVTLEVKSEVQEEALRNAEDHLEHSQSVLMEKEKHLQKCKEEIKMLKGELLESNKLCKRAEKQRNEALFNAEELTKAFQSYKKKIKEKLDKVQVEGDLLNKNLINHEKERDVLQETCAKLESELETTKEQLRNIQSKISSGQERLHCAEAKNAELISLLTQANQRILKLEKELENNEKMHKENESTKVNSTTIAELLIREAENRELQAKLMSNPLLTNNSNSIEGNDVLCTLEAEPVKLISQHTEERYLQLEHFCKQIQTDKERLTEHVKELQGKLSKAQSETTNTKIAMEQRTSQFQLIQQELMGKASKTTILEQELVKRSVKLNALQKLIEEKTQTHCDLEARNGELEQQLMNLKAQIAHLEENISKEHEEVLLAFEKSKMLHLDQQKELTKQIEHLQSQLEMKNLQITEQEHNIRLLQQDTLSKEQHLESHNQQLMEARRELIIQTKNTETAVGCLEDKVEAETDKVRQLESALTVCREELALYLHELEESKQQFEHQIKKKSEEVQCLQNEIKLRTQNLQETSGENVRLQHSLQQQQHMLQQGMVRIGELEDTQAELEKQVSQLEQEIEKQRSAFGELQLKKEEKLCAVNQECDIKSQQVIELNNELSKEKLQQTVEELTSCKHEREIKSNYVNQLQVNLKKTQSDLDKKTNLVTLLEGKLNSTKQDTEQKEKMESQLNALQTELQGHTNHIQQLQETLTKTHLSLEEKQVIIQGLTEELRSCKCELEDRENELLDMDQVLKDRNWELKQRAAQLIELDKSIQEHKGIMEQRITKLESALEKSELETRDHIKQITSLDERLQQANDQLCGKDFDLLHKEHLINQLKKDTERHQKTIADMENTLKAQEFCISEKHQDYSNLTQQMQLTHQKLLETQQQLTEAQNKSERLTQSLEDADCLSKEKLQCLRQKLEEANDTVCNLKTELQARNEVIKATNEVLILKESELTRLKAQISGYERPLSLQLLPNLTDQPRTSHSNPNAQQASNDLEPSDSNVWKMCPSLNTSDISLTDISSLDLPESILADVRNIGLPDTALIKEKIEVLPQASSDSLCDSTFNPLLYTLNESCDSTSHSNNLSTLSGMLKYIKKEMRLSGSPH